MWVVMSVFLVAMACGIAAGGTIYVDDDASLGGDGTSWATAYKYLQDGLGAAVSGDEVWVAEGIYKPDANTANPTGSGDREATFQLINGVAIRGGYAGFGEPEPNARDIDEYETILSGDLIANDIELDDPFDLLDDPRRAENSYSVVTACGLDVTTVLDGFTITAGNANGYPPDTKDPNSNGGGMYSWCNTGDCNPTVTNCTFSRNSATWGGGMRNDCSNPTVTNCTFSQNSGNGTGGGLHNGRGDPILTNCTFEHNSSCRGGGMYSFCHSNPTLIDCSFISNSVEHFGGGMYNKSGTCQLFIRCTFKNNYAVWYGGGLYNSFSSTPFIESCLFANNSSDNWGGAVHFFDSNAQMTNCTIVNNSAEEGAAFACGFWEENNPSNVRVSNCILWGNRHEIWNDDNSTIEIIYSDVAGGWPGEGNIDADPLFADADSNDYHLKSEAGRWNPYSQRWVQDGVTSPCIDGGEPNSDLTAELWPHGKRINMGAYGGTPQASMSLSNAGIIADLNTDDFVDYTDMMQLTDKWLYEAVLLSEDLSRDGIVNFTDFAIFARNWGLPGQASNPHPFNGTTGVSRTADLSWTAGSGATSHDVYFGTTNPPPFIQNQTATTFDPGTMTISTTYYWCIDEVGPYGSKTTGTVWSFTTELGPPPL